LNQFNTSSNISQTQMHTHATPSTCVLALTHTHTASLIDNTENLGNPP